MLFYTFYEAKITNKNDKGLFEPALNQNHARFQFCDAFRAGRDLRELTILDYYQSNLEM